MINPTNRQGELLSSLESAAEAHSPERVASRVRPRLHALLAEARAAARTPWSEQDTRVNAIVFHNMANWLPEAEREALRAAFRAELDRLSAADSSPVRF